MLYRYLVLRMFLGKCLRPKFFFVDECCVRRVVKVFDLLRIYFTFHVCPTSTSYVHSKLVGKQKLIMIVTTQTMASIFQMSKVNWADDDYEVGRSWKYLLMVENSSLCLLSSTVREMFLWRKDIIVRVKCIYWTACEKIPRNISIYWKLICFKFIIILFERINSFFDNSRINYIYYGFFLLETRIRIWRTK